MDLHAIISVNRGLPEQRHNQWNLYTVGRHQRLHGSCYQSNPNIPDATDDDAVLLRQNCLQTKTQGNSHVTVSVLTFFTDILHCVSKNDTGVAQYIFSAQQPILVIFDRDVAERVCYQMIFVITPLLTNVSALPGET